LRGYFEEGRTPWQGIATDAERSIGADDRASEMGERGGGGVCINGVIPINTMLATRHKQLGRGTGLGIGEDGDPQFTISTEHCHAVAYGWPLGFRPENVRVYEETATTICNGTRPGFTTGVIQPVAFADVAATLRAGAGAPKHEADFVGRLVAQPVTDRHILDDQGGSQVSVRTDGKAPTLRAEMHGNVPCVMDAIGFDRYNQCSTGNVCETLRTPGGGDNYPTVCVASVYDARGNGDGKTVNTLTGDHNNRITDYSSVVVEGEPVYCLQGNGIDRADTAGCNGKGVKEDVCYTLNTIDRPAVAYAMQAFGKYTETEIGSAMKARDYKNPQAVCCGVDCRNMNETPEVYPTLQAKSNGGQSLNYSGAVRIRYIVRRLTPTECARLQGFADRWAVPISKDNFTDEEYAFWLNVRNTHAEINGKATKQYTKEQMLKWYNGLHTDSSEYKLWGNGIALPTALYIMQGISDAIKLDRR
jgi:DNA (cytosine-5)-methyltransferase 1